MSRCDSAAMVPKTSELLPDPETPVNTVNRRLGIARLTSLRLLTRAPCTRMTSWLSASSVTASAHLVDPDEIACWVADRAVADAVRLVRRLLDDVDSRRLELVEGRAEVGRGEGDDAVRPLGHHLGD